MRLAFWTPSPELGWVSALTAQLARELELVLVGTEPPAPPEADLDVYHVADSPAHGFVYRALRERPGIVILADWNLHGLVHAETAGRGDPEAYRREARRAHGDTGTFVARQVLSGLGGALPALVAMNLRVLEASLGLVAPSEGLRARAQALLPGRAVLHLPFDRLAALGEPAGADGARDPGALAGALLRLVREIAPGTEAERRAFEARRAEEGTPLAWAQGELGWAARELGLAAPPAGTDALIASLFPGAR